MTAETPSFTLDGRVVVLTGGTSGIGAALVPILARVGAHIVLIARDQIKAEALRQSLPSASIAIVPADLSRLADVAAAAAEISASWSNVDLLINNAGLLKARFEMSADGFEQTMAVNHLAVAALTMELLPAMAGRGDARVIMVNSVGHRSAARGLGDPATLFDGWRTGERYRALPVYARAKLVNLMWSRALANRERSVTVNAVHPGTVRSAIGREMPALMRWAFDTFLGIPPVRAAANVARLAGPACKGRTGLYFEEDREVEPATVASDPRLIEQCWVETANALRGR